MNYKKKAVLISIIVSIITVLLIVGGIFGIKWLIDNNKISIEEKTDNDVEEKIIKVKTVDENLVKELEKFKEIEELDDLFIELKGNKIFITAEVEKNITMNKCKEIGNESLSYFSKNTLDNYDINYVFENDHDGEEFTIIGYKNSSKEEIDW